MCAICDHRPATANGFCHNCNSKLDSQKGKSKATKPVKYAHYRGTVIGFFRNGGNTLVPRLLKRKPESLPKGITINLDGYVVGLTREQVKKIKLAILTLSNPN